MGREPPSRGGKSPAFPQGGGIRGASKVWTEDHLREAVKENHRADMVSDPQRRYVFMTGNQKKTERRAGDRRRRGKHSHEEAIKRLILSAYSKMLCCFEVKASHGGSHL